MKKSFLAVSLFLVFVVNTAHAVTDCDTWFSGLNIAPGSLSCELSCVIAPVDMGTFLCHNECETLCLARVVPADCKQRRETTSCDFYSNCLEEVFSCGDTGYPLIYGYKYCKRFSEFVIEGTRGADPKRILSTSGLKWRDKTMMCLQNVFVDIFSQRNRSITCQSIWNEGFSSHVNCYTSPQNSVCELPLNDQANILFTPDFKDLLSKEAVQQAIQVGLVCLRDWLTVPVPFESRNFIDFSATDYNYFITPKGSVETAELVLSAIDSQLDTDWFTFAVKANLHKDLNDILILLDQIKSEKDQRNRVSQKQLIDMTLHLEDKISHFLTRLAVARDEK